MADRKARPKAKFREDVAETLIQEIVRRFREKVGVFRNLVPPQHQWLPKWLLDDGRKFACWHFFNAGGERGGRDSDTNFRWKLELLKQFPDLFLPEAVVADWNPTKIVRAFGEVGRSITNGSRVGETDAGVLALNRESQAQAWIVNATILHQYYGGDPRTLLYGTADWLGFITKVHHNPNRRVHFLGMRWKIWALFLVWMREFDELHPRLGLWPVPKYLTPIPVDIHILRLFSQWDVLPKEWWGTVQDPTRKRFPEFLHAVECFRLDDWRVNEIMLFILRLMERCGLDAVSVANALWLYSRSMCSRHPQAVIPGDAKRPLEWRPTPPKEQWEADLALWPRVQTEDVTKYPCAACAPLVRKTCGYIVPVKPRTKFGYVVRFERAEHPLHRGRDISTLPLVLSPERPKRNDRSAQQLLFVDDD
ncbi:hypothetical protein HYZ80_02930 [Candidatus Parcubacteria bacterium]|nr:hypothetical protein [Candidatus Parcubacteria bacterium]